MIKSLDIIVATYNGSAGIGRLLDSFLQAKKPENVDWVITVVDNNSNDGTSDIVRQYFSSLAGRLVLLLEKRQGKSFALNLGIDSTNRELVAFIDDDETVDAEWMTRVAAVFADDNVGYAGGPYVPVWPDGSGPPAWLPGGRQGVLGNTFDPGLGSDPLVFGREYQGTLMGGNAIVRRSVIDRVGKFNQALGRTAKGLLCSEDHDYQMRLQKDGGLGLFDPQMRIYHWIKKNRISKKYFRSWSFWCAYSLAIMEEHDFSVAKIAGIPRWRIRQALTRLPSIAVNASKRFESELMWWDLAGYTYSLLQRTNQSLDKREV